MSKRSEEFANKAYPNYSPDGKTQVDMSAYRFACAKGYEQAEKETLERAICWLKVHARDYIINLTESYPDAPFEANIGGKCWEDLKKAMEEE